MVPPVKPGGGKPPPPQLHAGHSRSVAPCAQGSQVWAPWGTDKPIQGHERRCAVLRASRKTSTNRLPPGGIGEDEFPSRSGGCRHRSIRSWAFRSMKRRPGETYGVRHAAWETRPEAQREAMVRTIFRSAGPDHAAHRATRAAERQAPVGDGVREEPAGNCAFQRLSVRSRGS